MLSGNAIGGLTGTWPGLADGQLADGDVEVTTDFRRVLSEILIRRLGNPNLGTIFPGYAGYSPLGVVTGTDLPPVPRRSSPTASRAAPHRPGRARRLEATARGNVRARRVRLRARSDLRSAGIAGHPCERAGTNRVVPSPGRCRSSRPTTGGTSTSAGAGRSGQRRLHRLHRPTRGLHPDFGGDAEVAPEIYGMPYISVAGASRSCR